MNVVTKVFMGMSFVGAMKLKSGRNSFGKRVVLNMHTLGKSHLNKLTKSLTTFLFQKVSEFPSVRRLGEWGGSPPPHYPRIGWSPQCPLSSLLWPKNVDFAIFVQLT